MLKLNFCCGDRPLPNYVNYDFRDDINKTGYPTAINQLDILKMDISLYNENSVDEILFLDAIEHFIYSDRIKILNKFYTWLKPNGLLTIQTPNLETICKLLINNDIDANDAARKIFGGQDHIGNFHYWNFTPDTIAVELIGIGFSIDKINDIDDYYWHLEVGGSIKWPANTNMVIYVRK